MHVLFIEDDPLLGQLTAEKLRSAHIVDWFQSYEEGLTNMIVNDYDGFIIDITLADGNGLDLCRQIRAHRITAPILILTGEPATTSKVQAFDLGADDYVTKPFSHQELLARLRALFRRPLIIEDTVLRVGELTIDTVQRTVQRKNQAILLRRKEYDILEYLARHPNQPVSRNQLFDHIWDAQAFPLSNTLDVHIKWLRDKIDRPFTYSLIQTVPGTGYCLRDMADPEDGQ